MCLMTHDVLDDTRVMTHEWARDCMCLEVLMCLMTHKRTLDETQTHA